MAKKKLRVDRLLVIILASILIVLLVVLGVKYLFKNVDNTNNNSGNNVQDSEEHITMSVKNSEVYAFDKDLGFGFVVVEVQFDSNFNNIEYDLSNLVTDEGIKLSDAFSYENKLKTTNHDFNKLNTTYTISVPSNSTTAKLFVPYILANNSIVITDMKFDNSLVIDISGNKTDVSTILNKSTEEQIISKDYSFTCSKPYVENMMKYNGEPYESSTLSIYVFKLTCDYISDNVTVTGATFTDVNGGVYDAKDKAWSSSKVDNIIGKTIKEGDTYATFFELYTNSEDKVVYTGKIKLNFSDDTSVEIETVLN